MKRRTFLMGGAALLASPWVLGSTLPKGTIKITVGWAPGGGTDVFARIVGQKLSELWGRPVIIENKPGATGMLAAEMFSKLRYSNDVNLLMAHVNTHAIAPHIFKTVSYDPLRDFAPIALIGATPHVLVTGSKHGDASVADVVALCKNDPGAISFGSSGTGSVQHLAIEMFNMAANVQGMHVPYRGSGPMQTDLIGGQIDFSFDTMTAATAQVKGKKLHAIAQTRIKRAKGFPDVPTMDEQGFKGFDASSWYGVVGPADMPKDLALSINADINKVLLMPDVIERFDGYGVEDGGGTVDQFAAFMADEYEKWGKVVLAAKITDEG
ncbi:tripartite tricarboxylate transporter substrate binding protein [Pollutimonas bauzanensis]|uniref:Bug family tripartite tricarboxylate transporter substrate binding protein n=1 Tax=Pollutimonas bauzanensis TaxID=658167 RepID=UPI003340D2FB